MAALPRVGILGIWHETNTYSAKPTSLADFESFELLEGEEIFARHKGTGSVIGGFCAGTGYELVPLFSAGAWPSGRVESSAFAVLLDRMRSSIAGAGRLDGVLLNLHGAMVAQDCDDVEATVVNVVRDLLGDLPVVAVLDLHANPSAEFVAACDVVISYDTYPHVDMAERGREAADFMVELLAGRRFRTLLAKMPLLVCPLAQATEAEPMQGLRERARARAKASGVERVCLVGGFAYSDVERAGTSVLAVCDEDASDAARRVLADTVLDIEAHADELRIERDDARTAVARALACSDRPVFLADVADNIGGGCPGDGTTLLAELLAQHALDAVVTIADVEVARLAASLGADQPIDVLVGGKTDTLHGPPVRIRGRITAVTDGRYKTAGSWMSGQEFSMGTTAVIQVDGVSLVVMERSTPPFHAEQLSSVGIDVSSAAVVVMKGALAFRAPYADVARTVIEVATPGACPIDISSLPRSTAPIRVSP